MHEATSLPRTKAHLKTSLAQRLITAVIGVPVVLGVVFLAPSDLAFVAFFCLTFWAAVEFVPLARAFAPTAPLRSLMALIPLASALLFAAVRGNGAVTDLGLWLAATTTGLVLTAAFLPVLGATEPRDGLTAFGILAFAVPFFAIPPVMLYWLQATDPWLVFILLAMVWLGDSAAYSVGSWLGRHKLAPRVSPNKTWEGSIAGFTAGMIAAAAWSWIRLGEVRPAWLAVAAATCIAAQLGDLVESHVKRGAGVKDSSNVLPGHGGFFDRFDALITAAPVFAVGAWCVGLESLTLS